MSKKKLLGIEIGNFRLKIAVSEDHHLEQMIFADIPENLVQQDEIVSWDAMAEFIKETLKANKISVKKVAAVIPEKLVYTKRVEMPAMTVEQLKVNLPYEFHDYITEDKDKYFYDYAVIGNAEDEEGNLIDMDLMAVAIPKDTVERYRTMFRRAGLRPVLFAPDYAALKKIIRAYESRQEIEQSKDYAILDIGHTQTKLSFFTGGDFEITRVMDTGLEHLDRYIEDVMNVGIHTARLYKESNKDNILEDSGCQEIYSQMAIEIMRVLNFYNFNHPGNMLDTLYCCGGGALIEPLIDAVRAVTEIRVAALTEMSAEAFDEEEKALAGHLALGITK